MNAFVRMTVIVLSGLCCFYATGCATVVRGSSQKMKIDSEPSGATLTIDGKSCTTPAEVVLKRNETHKVEVAKEGYRSKVFDLKAQWDGASLPGMLVPGGSIYMATDRASGADLAFAELPKVKLDPAPAGTPPQEMIVYRKKLLTKDEYEKTLEEEREEALRHRE